MKTALVFVLATASLFAQETKPPGLPAGFSMKRDVEYVPGGGQRRMLDVYYPEKSDKPLPLVVWIHGGAWWAGSKEHTPALPLLERGFAVASLNYRYSRNAVFPAQIEDCKSALRWLRKHSAELNIEPAKIGVWGASAGGHLVALLGVSGDVKEWDKGENLDQSSRVQAVCDWFGPADFLTFGPQGGNDMTKRPPSLPATDSADSPEAKLVGGPIPDNREKARSASPVTYATKDDAPFLIMHGDKDLIVPFGQSTELGEKLRKAGVPVKLVIFPGDGHGGGRFDKRETMEQVAAFFTQTLKN